MCPVRRCTTTIRHALFRGRRARRIELASRRDEDPVIVPCDPVVEAEPLVQLPIAAVARVHQEQGMTGRDQVGALDGQSSPAKSAVATTENLPKQNPL